MDSGVCKTVDYNVNGNTDHTWGATGECTSTYESADEYCNYVGNTCGLRLKWSEDAWGCVQPNLCEGYGFLVAKDPAELTIDEIMEIHNSCPSGLCGMIDGNVQCDDETCETYSYWCMNPEDVDMTYSSWYVALGVCGGSLPTYQDLMDYEPHGCSVAMDDDAITNGWLDCYSAEEVGDRDCDQNTEYPCSFGYGSRYNPDGSGETSYFWLQDHVAGGKAWRFSSGVGPNAMLADKLMDTQPILCRE